MSLASLATASERASAGAESHLYSAQAYRRDRREGARLDERHIDCWHIGLALLNEGDTGNVEQMTQIVQLEADLEAMVAIYAVSGECCTSAHTF